MLLSIVLATHNEAANIADCINSIKDIADEIIVVDGESTDGTPQIASKLGATVYPAQHVALFHINKQIALKKATSDWILQLDADERPDPELKQSIKQVLDSKGVPFYGYYLKRKNFFLGRWLKKGGQYPDPVIRLVRNGHAHFPQKSVHEQIVVDGSFATLDGHLLHYTAPTFSRYLKNSNRYTSLTATELKNQKIKFTWFNWINYLIWKPLIMFVNLYIRHKGFIDGFPGFVFALFSGLHWSIAFMKYWEIVNVKPQ